MYRVGQIALTGRDAPSRSGPAVGHHVRRRDEAKVASGLLGCLCIAKTRLAAVVRPKRQRQSERKLDRSG